MWNAKTIAKMDEKGIHISGRYEDCKFVPFDEIGENDLKELQFYAERTLKYLKKIRNYFKRGKYERKN